MIRIQKTKFDGMTFKMNFKGKPRIIKKNKGPNKGKCIFQKNTQHDNFEVCQKCDCHNRITKSATLPNI